MNSKKWTNYFIFFSFLILIIIALFNWKIDSFGIISKGGYLDNAARDLSKGKIISNLGKNYDERIFRKKIIENLEKESEIIALGSSRLINLRKRMFINKDVSFFNYSVTDASLEDYFALLQIHENKFGKYPNKLILGIDPWIFNLYNQKNKFLSIEEEYNQFLKKLDFSFKEKKKKPNRLSKLLSYDYLKENIRFIKENINNGIKGYEVADSIKVNKKIMETDGSIQYKYNFGENLNFKLVKEKAIKYTLGKVYSLENFKKINNKQIFQNFITHLIT